MLKAKVDFLNTAGRSINRYNYFRKLFTFSYKTKYTPTLWSSYSTSRYLPKVNENIWPEIGKYRNGYITLFIMSVPKCKQPHYPLTGDWINKLRYNLFTSNKKEWTTATCNNMDWFQSHNVEQMKPDSTAKSMYCMSASTWNFGTNKTNPLWKNIRTGLLLGNEWGLVLMRKGYEGTF